MAVYSKSIDKAKAIRFSTLASICKVLQCQPGDILEFKDNGTNI